MALDPVTIIGIGPEGRVGLSPDVTNMILCADELWGGDRLMAIWSDAKQKKVPLGKNPGPALQVLKNRPENYKVVILASGDPGFYGIAGIVLKILPVEQVIIYPQITSLQAGFARIRVPWNEAVLISVHSRPISEAIGLARRFPKLGILTDPGQSPSWIAEKFLAAGISDCRAIVIENMGEANEKIYDSRLAELPGLSFSPLNVLLLIHDKGWKPAPAFMSRSDSAYKYKNGLITKTDMRSISISRLGIRETDIIWDIGAGSGAMSIEMAELAWRGRVFSIEKDSECLDCLRENTARFGTTNLEIIPGEAPQACEKLPTPDVVFIGGSGGKLADILVHIKKSANIECRIAANFTLLENLMFAFSFMETHRWKPFLTQASYSYGTSIGEGTRLAPSNPVFILSGRISGKAD